MWSPSLHPFAEPAVQRIVLVMTMIRSLDDTSWVSLLPNELLFQIFEVPWRLTLAQCQRPLTTMNHNIN